MASIPCLLLLCQFALFKGVTSEACSRPVVSEGIELAGLQKFYSPGDEVQLSCQTGYTGTSGSRSIVCGSSGSWSKVTLRCSLRDCPYPDQLLNGEMEYQDISFLSTIIYSCNEGYTLHGMSNIVCLGTGTWSAPAPICQPVTCSLPPLPKHGMMVYDRKIIGHTTEYGFGGTYHCQPPLALIGNERGVCGADGNWSEPPQCILVTCPPPLPIHNGYMSSNMQRDYYYMDKVKCGCDMYYVPDGNIEIECQKTGDWSARPVCRAPCTVNIERGRILYQGKKLWIKELMDKKVLHADKVSFYCMDKENSCGYAVSAQCIDGQLNIPDCFEQPGAASYALNANSLPSEIEQC